MPVTVQLCDECRDFCGILHLCFCLDLFHKLTLLFFQIPKTRTPCRSWHGVHYSVINIIYNCANILYASKRSGHSICFFKTKLLLHKFFQTFSENTGILFITTHNFVHHLKIALENFNASFICFSSKSNSFGYLTDTPKGVKTST